MDSEQKNLKILTQFKGKLKRISQILLFRVQWTRSAYEHMLVVSETQSAAVNKDPLNIAYHANER